MTYYNEIDPFACAWLKELQNDELVPNGTIDQRSIIDVRAEDLAGVRQGHFFAGIGGWAEAIRIAGFPDLHCWTGSCPCQPFSAAGRGEGFGDERHLWPVWFRLIEQCRPPIILGEQVANAVGHGWLDLVFSDLEGIGYSCGATVLPACSVGAPHKRDRLFFVAKSEGEGRRGRGTLRPEQDEKLGGPSAVGLVDDAERARPQGHGGPVEVDVAPRREDAGQQQRGVSSFWSGGGWVKCRDGKNRPAPLEPSLFPLADGVQNRVGLLRGAGNAIVPQVAAAFVMAALSDV